MAILRFLTELGTVVAALVIVLDPLAILPILITVNSRVEAGERHGLGLRVIAGATILLLFFTITGTYVLELFGVTINDLRIGGGLLLIVIALNLVIEGRISSGQGQEYRAAVVPLISPLLIGPGAITASIVLAGIHGVWLTALAGVIAMFICYLVFTASRFIYRLIGDAGAALFSRIMGVFIATIGVSYMRTGIVDLIQK
ncbi:MAG: MarC family protein [Armatimonadota bacterium]|nr:MarC family protein [bacterium]